jgi:hypothetical protein
LDQFRLVLGECARDLEEFKRRGDTKYSATDDVGGEIGGKTNADLICKALPQGAWLTLSH